MKWQDKRVPWWALGIGLAAFAVIAFMLIQRQNNDLAMLERTYETVNAKRILLQYEQSELQHELSISNTSDYIASRARENGYMMPNELHFVVDNPEVLTDHATLGEVHLTTVESSAEDAAADGTVIQAEQAEQAEQSGQAELTEQNVPETAGDEAAPLQEEVQP